MLVQRQCSLDATLYLWELLDLESVSVNCPVFQRLSNQPKLCLELLRSLQKLIPSKVVLAEHLVELSNLEIYPLDTLHAKSMY